MTRDTTTTPISRRGLLRATVVSGAGIAGMALLVACGGAATAATSAATATQATTPAAATSVAATSSAAATTAASSAAPSSAAATSAASSASAAPSGTVVTLQLVSRRTGGSDAIKLEQALYDDFGKEHPAIRVEVTGGADTEQVLITRHAGGSPVDFVENDWGTWSDLASKQVIAELTPYFQKAKISLDIYAPAAVQNYSLKGKLYGEPVSMSVDALIYNVDLFNANGLAVPPVDTKDSSWTMEKFLEVAQKLTKGTDQFGFTGSANCYNTAGATDGTYFGMPSWDDGAQKSRFDTPEWSQGAQYWIDLRTKYKVQPTGQQATQLKGSLPNSFLSGKLGMGVMCSINWKPNQIAFKWAVATIPYSGKGDNISARMYPHGLHMDDASRHKDQVWEIFQWLTVPANGGRYPFIAGHFVSPILNGGSDQVQKARQQEWGIDPKAFLLESYTELPSGTGILKYANWPTIAKELTPSYSDVQAGKSTPNDYGRQAAQMVNDNIFKQS